jgi:hypothetical protein
MMPTRVTLKLPEPEYRTLYEARMEAAGFDKPPTNWSASPGTQGTRDASSSGTKS